MDKSGIIKRFFLVFFLILLGIILAGFTTFFILYRNEIQTITSLKRIDQYGMYEMTYYGDYHFDDFLETGGKDGREVAAFITNNISKWFPEETVLKLDSFHTGSTAFTVKNNNNEYIYGRNFDSPYSPSLVLHTNPKGGYKSISTVNLACLGFSIEKQPQSIEDAKFSIMDSLLMFAAPYIPFDGLNEKGVAISFLPVPQGHGPYDEEKVSLNVTSAIRLVLDKAGSVEEAIALLSEYNIYFAKDVPCQFLIADNSGTSIIVEYYNGNMELIYPYDNYQIGTNFLLYDNLAEGYGIDRYETVEQTIRAYNSKLPTEEALELLAKVGIRNNGFDNLQWSVLYNMTKLDGEIFAHRKFSDRTYFTLIQ